MTTVPDNIIVLAVRAISGEVSPNMRLIALGYDGTRAKFRFYMNQEASEEEREMGEVIAINFDAGHATKLETLDVEFVTSIEPLGKLDCLDFGLYRRNEE